MYNFYTWPNPSFPFRLYFNSPKARVFIIENFFHNYDWLNKVREDIRSTDFFFVYVGWNISDYIAKTNRIVASELGINTDQFFFMFNDYDEMAIASKYGFRGDVINHNAWLDENLFRIIECEKEYDAVYIARPSKFKRHYLSSKIENIALVAGGNNHNQEMASLPSCKNDPNKKLSREEIVNIINQSRCGLCLSEEEGACFSSSELLLCGVPVVSTQSKGGRDLWYNADNSVICRADENSVASAVNEVMSKKINRIQIRENHILKMNIFRSKFVNVLDRVLKIRGVEGVDAYKYFKENFIEKQRRSVHIKNVISIFNS